MRPKVRHVAVMTKNRERMVEFYQKVFGLEPKRGFGGAIYMSDGDVNIAFIEVKREESERRHQSFRLRGRRPGRYQAPIKRCGFCRGDRFEVR